MSDKESVNNEEKKALLGDMNSQGTKKALLGDMNSQGTKKATALFLEISSCLTSPRKTLILGLPARRILLVSSE